MSITKLSLAGTNLIIPGQGEFGYLHPGLDVKIANQPGCHKPNSPWPGIIKLFPAMESLVSDIPAWTGKSLTFFTVY
jgi:hypothetical protein